MKINDVLECINTILTDDRHNRNLPPMLGHFICHTTVEKMIGQMKNIYVLIDFVNLKYDEVHSVINIKETVSCPIDKVEEVKDKVILSALTMLFKILKNGKDTLAYDNFVTGEYRGENVIT